jgi:squalene monooxygenase
MTVALKDVVLLTQVLKPFLQAPSTSLEDSCPSSAASHTMTVDWDELREALREWHWSRKTFATSINILSVALYDLFGASGIPVPRIDFYTSTNLTFHSSTRR